MTHHILRLPAVKFATGLSRSTLYLRIAHGVFTHPVNLGGRAVELAYLLLTARWRH